MQNQKSSPKMETVGDGRSSDIQRNNEEVRALYQDDQAGMNISQEQEAYVLGTDRKTVSNYKNPNMPQCNVSLGAVPLSYSKHAFLGWLATKCGVVFIDLLGNEFNGASVEEIRKIGSAYAGLYEEASPSIRKRLLQTISANAIAAIKEEGL